MKSSLGHHVSLVASRRWLEPLSQRLSGLDNEIDLVELTTGESLPEKVLQKTELLVLEIPGSDPASMRRLERFREANPRTPVIAALESTDLATMRALMRHEVRHVVSLPFDIDELLGQLVDAGASSAPATPLAPLVSVTGAGSHAGASSLLINLAAALPDAFEQPVRCCIIDLDLQFGDIAAYGGLEPSGTLGALLEAGARLDADMLRDVATKASNGMYVVASPADMLPIDDIDIDQVLKIVTLARREFDYVFVDLPGGWTNWSLSVAAASDEIIVVTRQDLASVRHTQRCLRMFDDIGLDRRRVKLLINQVERSFLGSISTSDVEQVLGRNAIGWIPRDSADLSAALDQGQLLRELAPRAGYLKKINKLADDLAARLEGEQT